MNLQSALDFKSVSLPEGVSLNENAALKGVYGFTVGGEKPLVSCGYNNESTIFTLNSATEKEALSLALRKIF
jgi:hypothetical protein